MMCGDDFIQKTFKDIIKVKGCGAKGSRQTDVIGDIYRIYTKAMREEFLEGSQVAKGGEESLRIKSDILMSQY